MIIGLLGDIHGNAVALDAVLQAATRAHIGRLLITGDLVGYYFAPGRVLELLQPWDTLMVRGNHEDMLASILGSDISTAELERRYGSGLRLAKETLSAAQLDLLQSLPRTLEITLESKRIFLCHGAPWDTDQYVYPDAPPQLLSRCASPGCDFVVMGHTHYPMIKRVGTTMLVNPGSVGQPRHGRPGACWAVLDTQTGEVDLRNESYDIQSVVEEARSRHPEMPYLAEVLRRT